MCSTLLVDCTVSTHLLLFPRLQHHLVAVQRPRITYTTGLFVTTHNTHNTQDTSHTLPPPGSNIILSLSNGPAWVRNLARIMVVIHVGAAYQVRPCASCKQQLRASCNRQRVPAVNGSCRTRCGRVPAVNGASASGNTPKLITTPTQVYAHPAFESLSKAICAPQARAASNPHQHKNKPRPPYRCTPTLLLSPLRTCLRAWPAPMSAA